VLTIEHDGEGLVLKSAAAPDGLRLHARNDRTFFLREIDLTVLFTADGKAPAKALTVSFSGIDTSAVRIGEERP